MPRHSWLGEARGAHARHLLPPEVTSPAGRYWGAQLPPGVPKVCPHVPFPTLPPAKARGSAVKQILFFAVSWQGIMCPVLQLGVFCFSRPWVLATLCASDKLIWGWGARPGAGMGCIRCSGCLEGPSVLGCKDSRPGALPEAVRPAGWHAAGPVLLNPPPCPGVRRSWWLAR